MQLALSVNPLVDADLLLAQQLGVDAIVAELPMWEADSIAVACNRVDKAGLYLAGVESLPVPASKAPAGGSQTEIERACQTIDQLGKLGVPLVCYRWTSTYTPPPTTVPGRGGASAAVYAAAPAWGDSGQASPEGLGQALLPALKAIVSAAEARGTQLACQVGAPSAAPGTPGRPASLADLRALQDLADSPWHGLDLDHALFWQMAGGAAETIRDLMATKAVRAARVRTLSQIQDGLRDGFLDEDRVALYEALRAYRESGFEGPLRPAPSPHMSEDSAWGHKGYSFSLGYLRAWLQALG
jgi:mannonate dehydratase